MQLTFSCYIQATPEATSTGSCCSKGRSSC